MAKAASLSLRRKLSKSGKLEDFHAKVMESITDKHVVVMNEKLTSEHADIPRSYQLINVVYKDSSASTKTRVVTNLSVKRLGGSFNDLCLKGGSYMNSLLKALLGFSVFHFVL